MQAYMTMSMNHDPFIVDQVEKRESAKDSALSLSVVLFFLTWASCCVLLYTYRRMKQAVRLRR